MRRDTEVGMIQMRAAVAIADRLAARAVHYVSEDHVKYEQLVLYKSVSAARKAMRGLRADLSRCADKGKGYDRDRYYSKPLNVGDEGLRRRRLPADRQALSLVVRGGVGG
jgi:hypothetical protein